MKHLLLSLFAFTLLLACNPDKNKRADPEKLRFTTIDDAELFFKNLRQNSYDKEEVPATNLQVYRHSNRTSETERPHVQLALVINWRFDEAYLLIEPNDKISTDEPIEIQWKDPESQENGSYIFNYGNKEDHLRFAGQLYGSILDGHTLHYKTSSGEAIPFLNLPEERETFRISMFDFYRLTGNIR